MKVFGANQVNTLKIDNAKANKDFSSSRAMSVFTRVRDWNGGQKGMELQQLEEYQRREELINASINDHLIGTELQYGQIVQVTILRISGSDSINFV